MGIKKYMPTGTEIVKISLVVIVAGAIGAITFGQTWIKTHFLGRM